jgi:Methylase involved in ubiquinone/menaquinone biosynthesis
LNIIRSIIDIACGKGYLVERLLRETKEYVVATDFSPTILERNKEYFKVKGLYDKLSLIAFDARKTPFKDNSIELMTSNLGIQNIEQPGEVIRELNRINQDKFMPVMFFIDKEDTTHMKLFKEFGSTAYATKENAVEIFKSSGWEVNICNSYIANIKPTPVGEILKDAEIDGFPIEDTKVEFCVIHGRKH